MHITQPLTPPTNDTTFTTLNIRVIFTYYIPIILKLNYLFRNTYLKIAFSNNNTIHNILHNRPHTTPIHTHIAALSNWNGTHLNSHILTMPVVESKKTFVTSHQTTHNRNMPTISYITHINRILTKNTMTLLHFRTKRTSENYLINSFTNTKWLLRNKPKNEKSGTGINLRYTTVSRMRVTPERQISSRTHQFRVFLHPHYTSPNNPVRNFID